PGARNLDHVAAPAPFGPVELNERAVAAHPVPALERHVLHAPHADSAINRDALRFHVVVVRRIGPLPGAVPGVLQPFGFVPVGIGRIVHGLPPQRGMAFAASPQRAPCQARKWAAPTAADAAIPNSPPLPRPGLPARTPAGALSGTLDGPQVRGDRRCPRP